MKEKKNKRKKLKKKSLVIVLILLILIVASFFLLKLINKTKEKEIKKHFSKVVSLKKESNIYYKSKKIGINHESIKLSLESIKGKYYKIKNTDYYVYYKDTKKENENESEKVTSNYVVFNKNIKSNKKVDLYKDNKKIITLNNINSPIESIDTENYYISFLNDTYKVKKDKSIKEIKSNNTKDKAADTISVLFYEFISDSCNDYNCTTTENFKNTINKLKENGYYTLTNEEFKNYVSGQKNLKEKAILINTANYDDNINNLSKELEINIEKLEEKYNYRFISTYKPVKSNSDTKRINRYQIKNYTSVEDVLKMANGEELKQSTDNEINRQSVPVLNYHFFYADGEKCGEAICLNVSKFREHLEYLKNNNFKTLTMEEFKKWMYGEIEIPSKSVLITVDDGAMGTGKHNGNKLNPLLEEYELNATLFLITGWWDIENYRGNYLDIQSHTNDMHQYGTCGRGQINCYSYEEAKADVQKSIDIIGNDDSFCFPFYMTSERSLKVIKDLGFKLSFIGGNISAKRTNDKWLIPRYPITSDITLNQFIDIVN
ncbi:MAG: polysaccharide deacetylase family protein [Bacilli bacterium]|nr:polysaccharide deacetylase family protein [Bacilli bacterium]